MAPLVIPMTSCEANCAGSLTAWLASTTTSATTRTTAMRDPQLEDLMLRSRSSERDFVASSVVISHPLSKKGTGQDLAGPLAPSAYWMSSLTSTVRWYVNSPSSTR